MLVIVAVADAAASRPRRPARSRAPRRAAAAWPATAAASSAISPAAAQPVVEREVGAQHVDDGRQRPSRRRGRSAPRVVRRRAVGGHGDVGVAVADRGRGGGVVGGRRHVDVDADGPTELLDRLDAGGGVGAGDDDPLDRRRSSAAEVGDDDDRGERRWR